MTITHLGALADTTAGNHAVTATPAVGDLIVMIGIRGGTERLSQPSDTNSDGFGGIQGDSYYKLIEAFSAASPIGSIACYVRKRFIGSATSTTWTLSGQSSTGGGLSVYALSGMAATGKDAARNYDDGAGAAAATPAVALGQPCLTGNMLIGGVMNATSPAGLTPPSGWTESPTPDLGYSTPTIGFETCHRDTGETGSTITWGSTSASAFICIACEFDPSVARGGHEDYFAAIPHIQAINHLSPI